MRYFTHYWSNKTWADNAPDEGQPLDHISGNQFIKRGVGTDDEVYVVSVFQGRLFLAGKLKVLEICSGEEASAILNRAVEELYPASEHVVPYAATSMQFDLQVPLEITQQLRFVEGNGTKPLKFASLGILDQQTLRTLRELSPASAQLLNTLLPPLYAVFHSGLLEERFEEHRLPDEIPDSRMYFEGATKEISVNIYERDARARKACIAHHGLSCCVCEFNFESVYGVAGSGFIHVHHLKPLSEIGYKYRVDPVKDLRPVCPNCHAVIHKRSPAYTIDEMKQLIKSR